MKSRIVLLLAVFGLVAACSSTPAPPAPSTPSAASTVAVEAGGGLSGQPADRPEAPGGAAMPAEEGPAGSAGAPTVAATNVVRNFLESLLRDPGGDDARDSLSADLAAVAHDGQALAIIAGVEDGEASLEIAEPEANSGAGRAIVRATIASTRPVTRVFTLIEQEREWRINTVARADEPLAAEELLAVNRLVVDYFQWLENEQAGEAWLLLAPAVQVATGEADLARLAQSLERITPATVNVVEAAPDRIVAAVTLVVTPLPDEPSAFQPGANQRWIEFVRTAEGWRIGEMVSTEP